MDQKFQTVLDREARMKSSLFNTVKKLNMKLTLLAASFLLGVIGSNAFAASPAIVDLHTAGNFAILSKAGISDIPSSSITGNIGTSPITGAAIIATCPEVTGTIYTVDAAGPACRVVNAELLTTAVSDMETAYIDAGGRAPTEATELGDGNISGMTLFTGVYKWSTSLLINSDVTLSGSATDVWIFEIGGDLNVASAGSLATGIKVILTGGAKAQNVFWQVGGVSGATLGTYSTFNGNILSAKAIVLQTGAVLCGRALAQSAVTLDQNVVSDQCDSACIANVVITPSGSTTLCAGNSVNLTASGASTYLWSPGGQTNATITVSSNGTYTVSGTDINGCQGGASQIVTVNPSVVVTITGSTLICAGQSTKLTASGGTNYSWSTGQTTAAITVSPTSTTNYTVTVTGTNGCQKSAQVTVTVNICGTCPLTQGYWKNHASVWPVSTLMLGTVTYTKVQLLTILRKDTGNGIKGDASLILADQLIAAKLNLANGAVGTPITATIAAADPLIGSRTIPITPKITPNTAAGARMVALAATLDNFNNGRLTPGCGL
ncbi:MAG: hypothetical protein JWM68_1036 [Verrucomicrobiales bacterium]|nr:hypothetical protein [Verrucomicrobiales bacterium]